MASLPPNASHQAPNGAFPPQMGYNPAGFPGFPGTFPPPALGHLTPQQQQQFQQQQQQQAAQLGGWPYGAGAANGRPGQAAMPPTNPYMNNPAAPWAMGGLSPFGGAGAPGIGMPAFGMPDFGLLHQAYQNSGGGLPGSFFSSGAGGGQPGALPGIGNFPSQQSANFHQQQQQQLQLFQQQQQQQAIMAQQQQQHQQSQHPQHNTSSPAANTPDGQGGVAGSPMNHSRPASVVSQHRSESGVGGSGGPSRSNSVNKPRLSVNIPGDEGSRGGAAGGGGGAITQEGTNGLYTEEPEGIDEEEDGSVSHLGSSSISAQRLTVSPTAHRSS